MNMIAKHNNICRTAKILNLDLVLRSLFTDSCTHKKLAGDAQV